MLIWINKRQEVTLLLKLVPKSDPIKPKKCTLQYLEKDYNLGNIAQNEDDKQFKIDYPDINNKHDKKINYCIYI
jgi:hypothetical protein